MKPSSAPSARDSQPNRTPSPQTEYAWIILVIGAVLGAVAGHLLWRRALFAGTLAGTLGYLAGALVDRARRK